MFFGGGALGKLPESKSGVPPRQSNLFPKPLKKTQYSVFGGTWLVGKWGLFLG